LGFLRIFPKVWRKGFFFLIGNLDALGIYVKDIVLGR
jgi:hypothetical protein